MRSQLAIACALLSLAGCDRVASAVSGDHGLSICASDVAPADQVIAACNLLVAANKGKNDELARAYALRGLAKARKGDIEGGIADESATLALEPGNAFALNTRGLLHAQKRDFESALVDLNAAVAATPESLEPVGNRGFVYQETGRFAEAAADFSTTIRLAPRDFRGWNGRCWAYATVGKQLELALADCEQAIKLNPLDWNSHNSRGFVLFRMGRHADAIAAYDRAIGGDPKAASSWLVRGLAKRAAGDASGDADIAKALEIDPNVGARYQGYGIRID